MNVPGIVSSKGDEDMSEILFHHNDHEIYQMHQGKKSSRKPDIVVVPLEAAHALQEDEDSYSKLEVFGNARNKPQRKKHFEWRNIRSTIEFKRSKRAGGRIKMKRPPKKYEVTVYAAPKEKYMEYRQGMDPSDEPTDEAPAPAPTSAPKPSKESKPFLMSICCFFYDFRTTAKRSGRANNATSAQGPSNERKPSDKSISCCLADICRTVRRSGRLNKGDKKRTSDNLDSSNEPNSKRLKSNNEKPKDEEEPKDHPVVQNGLYAAEMMAAHVARQNVISSIIKSKSSNR